MSMIRKVRHMFHVTFLVVDSTRGSLCASFFVRRFVTSRTWPRWIMSSRCDANWLKLSNRSILMAWLKDIFI